MNLTFGCDPEVFATVEINGKHEVISPALLNKYSGLQYIPDDRSAKEQIKHPIFIKNPIYSWMMDGVACELTTYEYFNDPYRMFSVIDEALDELKSYLEVMGFGGNQIHLYKKPIVNINPSIYIPELEDEGIYQGFIFGCDPDNDAILPDYVCETFDVSTHNLRYGGGHWHTGSLEPDDVELMHKFTRPMVQLMAIFVGNIAIGNSEYPEEDKLRVFHYGKPGRYRQQKWGIEYRTPSNAWISNFNTIEMMMIGSERAFYYLNNPTEGKEIIKEYLPLTIDAITSGNQQLAKEISTAVL